MVNLSPFYVTSMHVYVLYDAVPKSHRFNISIYTFYLFVRNTNAKRHSRIERERNKKCSSIHSDILIEHPNGAVSNVH